MLKKIIIFFVAALYINASAGIGVQFHYCMGKLVSMALGHHADDDHACDDCGMEANETSCCKNETVLFKVKDDHQPVSLSAMHKVGVSEGFDHPDDVSCSYASNPEYSHFTLLQERPMGSYKLYLSLRVLRI